MANPFQHPKSMDQILRIGLSLSLALVPLNVRAGNGRDSSPPTENKYAEGGGINVRRNNPPADRALPQTEEPITVELILKNLNDNLKDNGNTPYVLGRQDEVDRLDDGLATSDAKTVILESDSGGGKSAIVEEYLRQHPEDKIFSLNPKKVFESGELGLANPLKLELQRLMKLAAPGESKHSGRIIFHVPNLGDITQGRKELAPLDVIWEGIAAKENIFFIIESRPSVTDEAFKKAEINLDEAGILRQRVKPAEYDSVFKYAQTIKRHYDQHGVSISNEALREASRLAVRKLGQTKQLNMNEKGPYARVRALIERSVNTFVRRKNTGVRAQEENNMKLQSLREELKGLQDDEKVEGKSEKLTLEIQRIEREIVALSNQNLIVTEPSGTAAKLSSTDAELQIAEGELNEMRDEAKKNRGFFSRGNSESEKELKNKESEVKRLTAAVEELKIQLNNEKAAAAGTPQRVDDKLVREIAAGWLGLNPAALDANFESGIQNIERINTIVIGQKHAIKMIADRLVLRASGLAEGKGPIRDYQHAEEIRKELVDDFERPLGSFWFGGPTGVGKTETARQLANSLGRELYTFDMSEFMEKHTVSRLIGSPPGYVGMGETGELIDILDSDPECVLLFDEVEKAHEDIQNIFLQLNDKGQVSRNDGKKTVSGRKAITIFTSNLAQEIGSWEKEVLVKFLKTDGEKGPGWTDEEIKSRTNYDKHRLQSEVYKAYVTNKFWMGERGLRPMKPEIVGRIDEMIVFNHLDKETILGITQKSMHDLISRLRYKHGIEMKLTARAIVALSDLYTDSEGARSMRRGIERKLRIPLAYMVRDNKLKWGQHIVVDVDEHGNFNIDKGSPQELESAVARATSEERVPADPKQAELKERLLNKQKRGISPAVAELVKKVIDPTLLITSKALEYFRGRGR